MSAVLYIVATPIGNLEDITYRAVRILAEVDLIAAEDTRHTLNLLRHYGISKPLTSYFDHNQQFKGERILTSLRSGKSVALVSDAGTPSISDPGYNLVRDAVSEGISVVPLPGACAAVTALSVSGLPSDHFSFAGFPPSRHGKRVTFLSSLTCCPGTLVIYEAPHRLLDTLRDIGDVMGNRQIVVARELTKMFEELIRGRVEDVIVRLVNHKVRGEIVILIAPSAQKEIEQISVHDELEKLLKSGCSCKDAVKQVTEITGESKSIVYTAALQLVNERELS